MVWQCEYVLFWHCWLYRTNNPVEPWGSMLDYVLSIPFLSEKAKKLIYFLFVCLGFFVLLENFSLIWRGHHWRWRSANFDLCLALMAIEHWGSLNVPHLLWHVPTLYNSHLRWPVTITPVAEHLAVEMPLTVLTNKACTDMGFEPHLLHARQMFYLYTATVIIERNFRRDCKRWASMSQHVLHDKGAYLLKGHRTWDFLYNLLAAIVWIRYFRAGQT